MEPDATGAVDTVLRGRWVVPIRPRHAALEDHAIALGAGRVRAVIPYREARWRWPHAEWSQWPRHALLPGLINAHTHAAMTLFRGLADDRPLDEWLYQRIWPLEQHFAGPEFVRDGAGLAVHEMLRSGTTCFNDMYAHPASTADVAVEAGIRGVIGQRIRTAAAGWGSGPEDALLDGIPLLERCQRHDRLGAALAPHALHTTSPERLRDIARLSAEHRLTIHMHLHETRDEVAESAERTGHRPMEILRRAGLLHERLLAVHATELSPAEISCLRTHGVAIVHCPESNLKLASGFCPVTRLREAGVPVAIGTDGAASNNDLDLWGEMRTARALAAGCSGDRTAVTAYDALDMATRQGAIALGLGGVLGTLERGCRADIIAVELDTPRPRRAGQVIPTLVDTTDPEQVRAAWVEGKCVMRGRQPLYLDAGRLRARALAWSGRLQPTAR